MSDHDLPLIDRLRARVPGVPVTLTIMGVNLLVFAAMLMAGGGLWHTSTGLPLAWGANFGPATQDGEWWRLGSALFLHFGLLHLGMNMWALWDSGHLVERMVGHGRFVLIYFAAGAAGNLISLVTHGGDAVSAGASGAIFGVYGALVTLVWRERDQMGRADFRWMFWDGSGFTAAAITFGFLVPGIDNAAHLGGLFAGILASIAVARRPGRLAAMAAMALTMAALLAAIPAPKYRWSEEQQARGEIREFLGADAAISARWQTILDEGRRGKLSFDSLAGTIETEVTDRYEASFEELSALKLGAEAPSAATVDALRNYAERRRDASRELTEGLRARSPQRVRKALEHASRAAAGAAP